ncbi:hypothetical protein [Ruthenibacterium lactatiformans]|uniref:hypothetical protein n=1 Tax=Ruthenibacterium lactatiformans TaxID=1550024 RepID=UPI003A95943A
MKTIVSLALAGLMSISALLPALAAQEAASASIPESSGISESVAQDESSVSSSSSTADESTAPESGSNAGADVSQPESDRMPVESDSSTSEGSETETSSSLPVSESTVSDETESAFGSETAESDANAEDSSGVTAATADERTVPVTVSEEYAILLATNQADSMMGHAGMERSDACTQPAASFVLADYAAETEDESYCLLWEAMNAEFEQLGAQGCTAANCVFTDDMIILMR